MHQLGTYRSVHTSRNCPNFVYTNSMDITVNHLACCVCMCVCVHAAVIHPPESQVALPGTVVNYVCEGDDTLTLQFNDSKSVNEVQAAEAFLDIGINFTLNNSVRAKYVYTVSVNASILNNGTFFFCLDGNGKSSKVYIYTVEGKARHNEERC